MSIDLIDTEKSGESGIGASNRRPESQRHEKKGISLPETPFRGVAGRNKKLDLKMANRYCTDVFPHEKTEH
jgi:hypothetical protein